MECLSFRFPRTSQGQRHRSRCPALETEPRFLMKEEEREPSTLVPHTKKCLLPLFQCHCEVGTGGERALGAAGTGGSGN